MSRDQTTLRIHLELLSSVLCWIFGFVVLVGGVLAKSGGDVASFKWAVFVSSFFMLAGGFGLAFQLTTKPKLGTLLAASSMIPLLTLGLLE